MSSAHKFLMLWCGLFVCTAAMSIEPFASTYKPSPAPAVLLKGATILVGNGERIEQGDVLIRDHKIVAVGKNIEYPAGTTMIDANGKWITPGIIDIHSHLGVYASPGVSAHQDGNEAIDPVTAHAWAEHSIWPQDPGLDTARAGGVTAMQILPGSANLIGGRTVTVKNVPALTYQAMKFPDAPQGLKMACGENPKRVYGLTQNRAPSTRMGNVAGYRQAFADAQMYRIEWDDYANKQAKWEKKKKGDAPKKPKRDLKLDTLADVLRGKIFVNIHCYRSDEMANMIDLAKEFDFKIASFHHGVEAFKLADVLAKEKICGALWADWWGFKMESFDAVRENLAIVDRMQDGCAVVHSDSQNGIQRLNQEAAKAMAYGNAVNFGITPERAIRWITQNPAKAMQIDQYTGTLEPGKMADVVIWNGNPFSVYALAEKVFIDGSLQYDRNDSSTHHRSDFLIGQPVWELQQ